MLDRRVVIPEILDSLDSADPEAIRSRADLRMINFLMGNERWILRQLRNHPDATRKGVVEIGAGEGALLRKLHGRGPSSADSAVAKNWLTGLDIAPRPANLPDSIHWHQNDLFQIASANTLSGGSLVACLFLHHFEDSQLQQLSAFVQRFEMLCIVEPLRRPLPLTMAALLRPLVNRVTRHDMPVSIRAGFDRGELFAALGISAPAWAITEHRSWLGGIRSLAVKTHHDQAPQQ